MTKVATRWHERSLQAHSLCLNHKKDPQPESLATLKLFSSFSLVGSLVTVRLTDLCFLLFFFSVLGEVVATGGDGPVFAVLGAELPPFEALTNSSS